MSIVLSLPCFKRVETLKELCKTLLRADYLGDKVDIVFSIDYSETDTVSSFAEKFIWPFGEKKIIRHTENIGLRKNILFCGDLTSIYDAVIVIEDDLEVMPSFYKFAKQAASFYIDEDKVGGISIYAYHLEENTITEFHPYYEGYDSYFIQWASSWGQLWTKKQWRSFREWYSKKKDINLINIPENVKNWNHSWKKYYIAYLVDTSRYFVFPFFSHIYNGNKAGGVHTTNATLEVFTSSPLNFSISDFRFAGFNQVQHKYDSFFQHEPIHIMVDEQKLLCEFDLYGNKTKCKTPYIITSKGLTNSINAIHSFDSGMLPLEQNIFTNKHGNIFHIVKTDDFYKLNPVPTINYLKIRRRLLNIKQLFTFFICAFMQRLKH